MQGVGVASLAAAPSRAGRRRQRESEAARSLMMAAKRVAGGHRSPLCRHTLSTTPEQGLFLSLYLSVYL
jgi:hypothetical protein